MQLDDACFPLFRHPCHFGDLQIVAEEPGRPFESLPSLMRVDPLAPKWQQNTSLKNVSLLRAAAAFDRFADEQRRVWIALFRGQHEVQACEDTAHENWGGEAVPRRAVCYSTEFEHALSHLEDHGISPSHALAVTGHWAMLVERLGPREPIVQITAEGAVQFAWNRGGYYLDCEVHSDGRLTWFFRDRSTDTAEGTDGEPEHLLPPEFWARLAIASASAKL